MDVSVCIGSSCHLKGSYDIISTFKRLIAENDLEDKVSLNASFCLGLCQKGVTARVDETLLTGLSPENAEEQFKTQILSRL